MKNNQPVTQREINYPESSIFVTKTDTKGIITYASDAFVEVCGFSREELLGANHNIVRHPDMPTWAFADLWKTVKQGHPWRGIVKNRAKSGDHYWVRATVSPIIKDNEVVGYLSLRRKPTREEVSSAEQLYQSDYVPRDRRTLSERFRDLSLQTKLHIFIQPVLLILLGLGNYLIADHIYDQLIEQTQERAGEIANEVIDNANMLMIADQISNPEQRQLMLRKLSSGEGILNLRLLRAEQVSRQFGPGLPEEQPKTELEKRVLAEGVPHTDFFYRNGVPVFRQITPYIASHEFHGTDCLACHKVESGSVNGASSIEIDMSREFKVYHNVMIGLIGGQIILQLALLLFTSWVIRRFITRPVNAVKEHLNALVNGDMTAQVEISARDEMGEILCAVQSVKVLLGAVIDQNVSMTRSVDKRAKQLAHTVTSVEQSAASQVTAAAQMADTMEQMSHSIEQVAQNTLEVKQISEHSKELADTGGETVQRVVADMARISDAVQVAAQAIQELGAKSSQIQGIVKAIKEIADQTNLLALNAAIEAARAGEQGRGFAVVADEVRSLAEKTAQATQQIAGMTSEIHQSTQHAVTEMSTVVTMVQAGSQLAEQAGVAIVGINQGAAKVMRGVEDIVASINQQSQASRDISGHVEQVAQMTAATSDSVKEVEIIALKLEHLSRTLNDSIDHFKV